jgi:hypothetical protein
MMSRYLSSLNSEQLAFDSLAKAKAFVDDNLPAGSALTFTDAFAKPGDTSMHTFVSGTQGSIQHTVLPYHPIK